MIVLAAVARRSCSSCSTEAVLGYKDRCKLPRPACEHHIRTELTGSCSRRLITDQSDTLATKCSAALFGNDIEPTMRAGIRMTDAENENEKNRVESYHAHRVTITTPER